MPSYHDEECPLPRGRKGAARPEAPAQPGTSRKGQSSSHARPPIDCEFRDGVTTVRGKARAHYTTGHSGRQMLVVDRAPGERIRINSTTEVVILEVGPENVRIAIETSEEK